MDLTALGIACGGWEKGGFFGWSLADSPFGSAQKCFSGSEESPDDLETGLLLQLDCQVQDLGFGSLPELRPPQPLFVAVEGLKDVTLGH